MSMDPVALRRLIHGLAAVGQARKAMLQAGGGVDAAQFQGGRALQREHLEGKRKSSDKRRKKNRKKRKPPLDTDERPDDLEDEETPDPKALAAWIKREKRGKAGRSRTRKSLGALTATAVSNRIEKLVNVTAQEAQSDEPVAAETAKPPQYRIEDLYEDYAILRRGYGEDAVAVRVAYRVVGTGIQIGRLQPVTIQYIPVRGGGASRT